MGRKPATINRYLVSLKRYFGWAVEQDLLRRDPARVVKLVEETARPPRHLTDQEEAALVAAVEGAEHPRDRTLIILMLHTGLRVSEVCRLQVEHVGLRPRSGYLRVWGKRDKYREIPLNATARQALEEYLPQLPISATTLFPSQRTGEQLTPRAIGFIVHEYAKRANIEPLRPHDLRHRFGYRMAEKVPLHRLAQIMGHDSLDTTMHCVQSTQQDLQAAVETIVWE